MTNGDRTRQMTDEELIKTMRPDDTVACRNATVFQDKDGNFSGWIDNDDVITSYTEIGGENK